MDEPAAFISAIIIFIGLCAFLSVGEASISSVGSARAQAYGIQNDKLMGLIDWELAERSKIIITILVAHNIFSVAASSLLTVLVTGYKGHSGILWATLILTVISVLFADFYPKCLGIAWGERCFSVVLPVLKAFYFVLKPIVIVLDRFISAICRLFNVNMTLESSFVTRDEIEQIVHSGEESGILEADERRMIDGVISFDETRVSEIMVPRVDMDALEDTLVLSDLIPKLHDWEHSRIPIYHEIPDKISGIVYVKDIIPYLRTQNLDVCLSLVARKALFVPETMVVNDLFELMRQRRVHFAVVVDEYGGTAGIVTLEDLLEEIVGDIQDEYDKEENSIVQIAPDRYRVKCTESLEELELFLDHDFGCDDVDSVGGYVLDVFHGFPKAGDVYSDAFWTIKVTDAEPHRVNEVLFIRNDNVKNVEDYDS